MPIIGDLILTPSLSSDDFKTDLFGETTALVFTGSINLDAFDTLIFVCPSCYSNSDSSNSLRLSTSSLINFLSIFIF